MKSIIAILTLSVANASGSCFRRTRGEARRLMFPFPYLKSFTSEVALVTVDLFVVNAM